jgi:two-component system copper resistance phosphate regulon response regulator CusR
VPGDFTIAASVATLDECQMTGGGTIRVDNHDVRLLLIEDEPMTAQMLAKGLREHAYAVDVASTARQAVALVNDVDYELIVLDLGLPDADGLSVCRRLRENGTAAAILMLTARSGIPSRIAGLDSGADDYLTKPFDFGELLARLRALTRRATHPPEPERQVLGNLVIDRKSQQVWCHGINVPLSTKEYALLEFLAKRHGRVVTRGDIAEHVWDNSYDPFSNVIDVYIRRLRAKLLTGGCEEAIRTRRGEGYQLSIEGTDDDR